MSLCLSCETSTKLKSVKKLPSLAFERSGGDSTSTYSEVIKFYKALAEQNESVSITKHGKTDSGKPLHLIKYSSNKATTKPVKILINNGIHPGESDGIDASMLLFRDLAKGRLKLEESIEIYSIPIYNIGGALNRNSSTRTNQNGPSEYGFRGNARNYDLNRDFIKSDTKNSKAFYEIFHLVKPHVFVDTHVSNGADYQYTLTHLFTQHNKLGGDLGTFLNLVFRPEIEKDLAKKNWNITPYVNVFNQSPEVGFSQFNDSPRYSTGYTTLFNSLGLMIETHMLKPYNKRVKGTFEMLKSIAKVTEKHKQELLNLKEKQAKQYQKAKYYSFNYQVDRSKHSNLDFLGYQASTKLSKVTGLERLKFNRNKPQKFKVDYFNYFKASDSVSIPQAYIIPQQYVEIIDLLKKNTISMNRLTKDSSLNVEVYSVKNFETRKTPYEGHYLHNSTEVTTTTETVALKAKDVIVYTNQPGIRYLIETLEPEAVDSFFNWNYFDAILQQKEGFSPYVFEDKALKILNRNKELKFKFDSLKSNNTEFKANWYRQLEWIHKHSLHYEKAHLRYPIFRLPK